jgi:hypothetical protein
LIGCITGGRRCAYELCSQSRAHRYGAERYLSMRWNCQSEKSGARNQRERTSSRNGHTSIADISSEHGIKSPLSARGTRNESLVGRTGAKLAVETGTAITVKFPDELSSHRV